MKRFKVFLGIILLAMAMGELATGFLAYPAIIEWSRLKTEWWAYYFPIVLLINSMIASILLMYYGVKMLKSGSFFTEKQAQQLDGKISRWFEKRKYGYCKSDYAIKEAKGE